jgi:ectoine hydroxylase-related dioxygenase (phytanoyl-CoA dioxygenase family)
MEWERHRSAIVERNMDWRTSLINDGFAIFPQLIAPALVDRARIAIDENLRVRFDPARQSEYDHQSYCPDLRGTPPISDLMGKSEMARVLDEALGLSAIAWDGGQIAIRRAHNVDTPEPPRPHIDGFASGKNGLEQGKVYSFTCLAGIFLTETARDFAGNFTVWPGSHRAYEEYFRARGDRALNEPMPELKLGVSRQIHARPGDAILCHYQLAHSAAVNTSDIDRIAVYFRTWLRDLDVHRWHRLTNIWHGWRV